VLLTRSAFFWLCTLVYGTLASAALVATPASAGCAGDCDNDGTVTVDELIAAVNIALDQSTTAACSNADISANGSVTIDELLIAVGNALHGCPFVDTKTPTPTWTSTPEPSATPTQPAPIPTTADELLAWLELGSYRGWTAESAPHPSAGPHFGTVRTFLNPIVLGSLAAGLPSHPAGSALVKELYGSEVRVQGWSVMVKVQDDSAEGTGWYWLERFRGSTFASGIGVPGCTGCHSLGNDLVRTPYPLQ
jgi:hypothetical protein